MAIDRKNYKYESGDRQGSLKKPTQNAERSMHRKRFVFVGAEVLDGKQICEDKKYICKTFFCIWILFT